MYSEKRVAYLNGYKMKENVDKHINSPILFNTKLSQKTHITEMERKQYFELENVVFVPFSDFKNC